MSKDKSRGVKPMASASRDMKELKNNGGAAARELREFLAQMRGKNPKEMLGEVAQSSLLKSFVSASFIFLLMLGGGTVLPYGCAMYEDAKRLSETPIPSRGPSVIEEPEPETAPKEEVKTAPATEALPPAADNPDDLLDRLGVGEQKTAPLDSNPLENSRDDLFKDLE